MVRVLLSQPRAIYIHEVHFAMVLAQEAAVDEKRISYEPLSQGEVIIPQYLRHLLQNEVPAIALPTQCRHYEHLLSSPQAHLLTERLVPTQFLLDLCHKLRPAGEKITGGQRTAPRQRRKIERSNNVRRLVALACPGIDN
jgi:hypothetical protein